VRQAARRLVQIDDEQMIANGVVLILVAAAELGEPARNGRHFFEEHLIA